MAKIEESFGVIPLRKDAAGWSVFLVKNRNGGHWGFPKGRALDSVEEAKLSAKRELQEETNLDIIKFIDQANESFIEHYHCIKNNEDIDKTVTYFLAEVMNDVILQEEEISDGKWVDIITAKNIITYDQSKNVCDKVVSFLRRDDKDFNKPKM
jgi:bis(5'-nucleosidyl)-tetraphosphatase